MSMSTLAQRLQKVQAPPVDQEPDFTQFSTDQMETMKIQFGKTHVDRTFNHMWCNEQRWVLWFAQHYHRSAKWEHRLFLHYVERKIERCEMTGVKMTVSNAISQDSVPKLEKSSLSTVALAPKAKCRPEPMPEMGETMEPNMWDLEGDPELFEVVEEHVQNARVDQMEARLASMENAINRIVLHLEETAQSHAAEQ